MEGVREMSTQEADTRIRTIAESTIMVTIARTFIVIGIPAMIGLAGWSLHTSQDLQVSVGQIEQWETDHGKDLYTARAASSDLALRDSRIDSIQSSFALLDGRVSWIERNGVKR